MSTNFTQSSRINVEQKLNQSIREKFTNAEELNYESETTILLRKNKQIQESQHQLDERRERYKQEIDGLNDRQNLILRQKQELEQAKKRFERFTKENEEKRRSALTQMHEERDQENKLRSVLRSLTQIQASMSARERCLKHQIQSMKIYEEFLINVVSNSEEFPTADSILQRFQNLKQTRDDLIAKLQFNQQMQEVNRQDDLDSLQQKQQQQVNLQANASKVIAEIDKNSQVSKLQLQGSGQEIAMEKKKIDVGEIVLGIDNLYNRVKEISALSGEDSRREPKFRDQDQAMRFKVKIISDVIGDLAVMELFCMAKDMIPRK
ncbi:hypothetical protein SS50377_23243 [Spironucleus salmonicida]|uniref:DUF4200 domain-containing protein n=1 Tax=Spironucleus salmonicida TaxID=348837 RepID=V6LID6_9EUKA|nr:hypothetical protein SS50377_23243 [Spironucleus salmonicida]|eukprot:EST44078.1 hypothetical protein SS50377_16147 [Spironucleus salmonicida]